MPLFSRFRKNNELDESSGDECEDASASGLSHIGTAAYNVLRRHHNHSHHELWNVTKGQVVRLMFTPTDAFTRYDRTDPTEGHSDWLLHEVEYLISRTEEWCDIVTLSPPKGRFWEAMVNGIKKICEKEGSLSRKQRIIRIIFGNIPGIPTPCEWLMKEIRGSLPADAGDKIKLWVGSWRKGASWNHAKIIAVDGKYLLNGGHNLWDRDYLKKSPCNDISILMKGNVARDGHRYANAQWGYIVKKQSTVWGRFVDKHVPDSLDVPRVARVNVSAFPESSAAEFPPFYTVKRNQTLQAKRFTRGLKRTSSIDQDFVPVITVGRYGVLLKDARPSDDAFAAMFDNAKTIIRFALQDLGPLLIPNTKMTIPGGSWPHQYMNAMARAMWTKGVDIEIVLSNANCTPDSQRPLESTYGFGWSCVDVAAEIIKCIQTQFPDAPDNKLRETVEDNLRVCYLRCPRGGRTYSDGTPLALHSKHFIVDDVCCYIGSQNLYICDLAEWGVLIDDPEAVGDIKKRYWDQLWQVSYTKDDCDVDKVMDGLGIDRAAPSRLTMTKYELEQAKNAMKAHLEHYWDSDESDQSDGEDFNEDNKRVVKEKR